MMRMTKLGHACVRLENEDRTLVIDPGGLTSESDALSGADAVLITHEHFDHLDADRLRKALSEDPRLEIWTCRSVAGNLADLGGRVHTTGHGEALRIAGFDVHVYGEQHEVVHPDIPPIENVGFLVDGRVFHPGDALTVPEVAVPTLCLPVNAPWMKATEMFAYIREVGPDRAYAIHDGALNEAGLALVEAQVGGEGKKQGKDFRRLKPGETTEV